MGRPKCAPVFIVYIIYLRMSEVHRKLMDVAATIDSALKTRIHFSFLVDFAFMVQIMLTHIGKASSFIAIQRRQFRLFPSQDGPDIAESCECEDGYRRCL